MGWSSCAIALVVALGGDVVRAARREACRRGLRAEHHALRVARREALELRRLRLDAVLRR
eukprot:CAMPEP_0176302394 /NCGR_PEP_ID=MMETSP0121_2-20121125/61361_1 /TAXON_ID=160619 /ORGANISM="Kryptoperidinium foliaceum, Strain CCMP 1326" /LENGTH=59 /DNA_ID=CAMNT_0017643905 /DNA_START=1 /DNA_END=177 /DNA_ORIENTATION=+